MLSVEPLLLSCDFVQCPGDSEQALAAGDESDKLYVSAGGIGVQTDPSPGGPLAPVSLLRTVLSSGRHCVCVCLCVCVSECVSVCVCVCIVCVL